MSAPLPPGLTGANTAAAGPAPASPGLVPLADVMIRALPDKLAGLDRAVVVSGQVVAQEDGKATIRTAAGDVTVETPAPLPTDRPVTLRIPPQVPGTPPRAAAMAPPQVQTPAPPVNSPATSQTAAAQAPTPVAPPLPQIQPGATIAAIVVAAIQPRPVSPPPAVSTTNAAAGDSPVELLVGGPDKAPTASTASTPPTANTPAPPAATTPSQAPLPAAAAQPAGSPVAGGSLPSLASLLGGGGDASPIVTLPPGPAPAATIQTSPEQPPIVDAPADMPEPSPSPPPPPRTEVTPDRDAARLARLARYNIPTTPSSGLFAFSDLEGPPGDRNPVVEARLRGTAPPAPATAPPTATTATPPPPAPGPAATPQTSPAKTEAPAPPDDATPPPALPPDTLGDLARLRGTAPAAPPTAPPTGPPTAPPAGDTAPDVLRPPAPAATNLPPMQEARVRDGAPPPSPGTAPPTVPIPATPAPPAGTVPQQAAPIPDNIQIARTRDGPPPSPPTAPPTVPTQGDARPKAAGPQPAPTAEMPQLTRLRDAPPPSPPTAPPTTSTDPAPAPPARPGETKMQMPVQEARIRDAAPPTRPTAPPTAPPTIPVPTGTPAPTPRPAQALPDAPVQQARLRDGLPPPPPTAPPTKPVGGDAPAPGRAPSAVQPSPPAAAPRAPVDPMPAPARPAETPAPEPVMQLARARGDAPPAAPTAPPTVPATPTRPAPLPNGQPVQLRVLSVEGNRPQLAAPGIAPPLDNAPEGPPPTSIIGTLVGNTAQGQPVVTTPQGTLVLRARTDLPPGTNLTLALEIPQNRELSAVLPPLDPAQGSDWPALREVMSTLLAADPAMARTIAAAILPQPTKRLTTNLTFFLAALRGGDAAGWLGSEATELVTARGGGRLLARLREDFQAAARQAAEPTPDGWRAMPIPFGTPDQVMRAQLHVRSATEQEGEEVRGDGRGPPKRFLLDLNFSRIGPMQLDGMVWTGRFDLMIRTQTLLPAELRQSIGTLFRDSLETVGYAGTIGFQTGAHAWARVQAAPRGSGVRA